MTSVVTQRIKRMCFSPFSQQNSTFLKDCFVGDTPLVAASVCLCNRAYYLLWHVIVEGYKYQGKMKSLKP